jgi:ComF family protein
MINSFINLLFPKVCAGCKGFLLKNEIVICTNCRHEIPMTQFHLLSENDAFKIFYGKLDVQHVSSFLNFHKKGIVQELIHRLKYHGNQEVGTVLGNWYAEDLKKVTVLKTIDFIIPVPLHKNRLKKRGYNQVETFGKALSEQLNIVYNDTILVRKLDVKTQSRKNFEDRINVNLAIFDVVFDKSLHNKHFLLIDDVLTTGATLENCGKAILKIPSAKLSIVTIAISHL